MNGRFIRIERNGIEGFDEYGIRKISIPFHFIASPAKDTATAYN